MSKEYRARLRPSGKHERFSVGGKVFEKSRGWYAVSFEQAKQCAVVRSNPLNPHASEHVFDVMELEQAQKVAAAEAQKEDPRGTVDKPARLRGEKAPAEVPAFLKSEPDDSALLGNEAETAGDMTSDLFRKAKQEEKEAAAEEDEDDAEDEDEPEEPEASEAEEDIVDEAPRVGMKKTGAKKKASKKASSKAAK